MSDTPRTHRTPHTSLTVNRARHALAVTVGWGRPATDPAGLGLPLAVARDVQAAREDRTARARVRG
ncbi:hypothetical protein [Streptomyces formicae]|uniref:Uncharacterized protein n=1 Tax=Streptomyces formicae TaxID=1616117 RepID=A0A291QBG5_9ACTN|nr:hypothetical protein [Streptomyces formicae]ATL28814.1 hypothetical protein KY5_3796 [Streptomyces formicae]